MRERHAGGIRLSSAKHGVKRGVRAATDSERMYHGARGLGGVANQHQLQSLYWNSRLSSVALWSSNRFAVVKLKSICRVSGVDVSELG